MKRLCLFLIISLWAITSQAQRIITFDEYQAIEDEERKNSVQWLPYRTEGATQFLSKNFVLPWHVRRMCLKPKGNSNNTQNFCTM